MSTRKNAELVIAALRDGGNIHEAAALDELVAYLAHELAHELAVRHGGAEASIQIARARKELALARRAEIEVAEMYQSGSDGAEMIRTERVRQVAEEGYDAEHDDGHDDGLILSVAGEILCFLDPRVSMDPDDPWGLIARHARKEGGDLRLLTIAGALIAAEIDRRLRAGAEDDTERARRKAG